MYDVIITDEEIHERLQELMKRRKVSLDDVKFRGKLRTIKWSMFEASSKRNMHNNLLSNLGEQYGKGTYDPMRMLEVFPETKMAARKKQVNLLNHLSLFDWRVAIGIGFLMGIVVASAPQMIGAILLLGLIMGTIKLVDKGRI